MTVTEQRKCQEFVASIKSFDEYNVTAYDSRASFVGGDCFARNQPGRKMCSLFAEHSVQLTWV